MNNIIFDGNYLFYKTLFIFSAKKGQKVLESANQQHEFMRKVATDMAFAIRQFGAPERVIFTIDGRSWRKDIEIVENQGYKAHRKKGAEIDWDAFYGCMTEFGEILEQQGMIVSKLATAEGDDLMYLWSQVLLRNGENSIVITGDKDLLQLVRTTKKNYAVVYNPNSKLRKIYGNIGLREWVSEDNKEVDMFDTSSFIKTGKDLIQNALNKIDLEELNPASFLLKKVLIGDDGDGVPSIFHWPSKNGKVTNRITAKRASKVLEYMNEKLGNTKMNVFDFPKNAELVCEGIKHITKQVADPEVIKSKLERNITLMVLHKDTIPAVIVDEFKLHATEKMAMNTLPGRKWDMSVILDGTKYIKPPESFQSGLFSALDSKS
jgi:5'-3' exonuclease